MIEFRVMFIDYLPDHSEEDMDTMKKKAKTLKRSLTSGPMVIFNNQVMIEPNFEKKYYVVLIQNIPMRYVKKVFKECKKSGAYSIRASWTRKSV